MALDRPFEEDYIKYGCFEYHASDDGIARIARVMLQEDLYYSGYLKNKPSEDINSHDVFMAFEKGDPLASRVIGQAIQFWGTAAANLISIFNPEKIIFGGGFFGPAVSLIPLISGEAEKWAQPIYYCIFFNSSIPNPGFEDGISFPFLML